MKRRNIIDKLKNIIGRLLLVRIDFFILLERVRFLIKKDVCLDKKSHRYYKSFFYFIRNDKSLLVYDVGGNVGNYAKIIFRFFPMAKVISFEPQRSCLNELEKIKQDNPNKFLFETFALSDSQGKMSFTEYKSSTFSSLNPILKGYKYNMFCDTQVESITECDTQRLDDYLIPPGFLDSEKILLKVDVQGAEMSVLKEAESLFINNKIDYVMIELMTIPKYENQESWLLILNYLDRFGFMMFDMYDLYRESNGALTEIDVIFIQKERFSLNGI